MRLINLLRKEVACGLFGITCAGCELNLKNISTYGSPVGAGEYSIDVELPPRGDSPFAEKIFNANGGEEDNLSDLLCKPDERYINFNKPFLENATVAVAFDHAFNTVWIYAKVNEPLRATGYCAKNIVHLAKNGSTNVVGGWQVYENLSESGYITVPDPYFSPNGEVEIQIDTGYCDSRVFLFEMEGNIDIDGFAINSWSYDIGYECER
mgnify:CR=1 FL=1